MGKPRSMSKKAKKLAKKKGVKVQGGVGEGANKYTIDEILDKASEYVDEYNYEMAQKFCQRALEMDSDNVRALETTATLLLEAGDVENAKHCLGRSITVAPEAGHSKYLSLAQLLDGQDSLGLYRKGIELLNLEVERLSQQEEAAGKLQAARRELSNSYCAVAELFTTDLCDLDEAESECTSCIQKSIESDESNPEAWQTKARLHLIKTEFEDAKSSMDKSLSLWLPKYMDVLEDRDSAVDPIEVCPLLYTTRLATAKILMELEDWDNAVKVLNGLTEEDELVVDTWYLLGLVNKLRSDFEVKEEASEAAKEASEGYKGNARYYLKKALKVQSKSPTDDEEMIAHVKELIEEIGKGDDDDDDDDDGQEGWEDCDSETDEEDNMEAS